MISARASVRSVLIWDWHELYLPKPSPNIGSKTVTPD